MGVFYPGKVVRDKKFGQRRGFGAEPTGLQFAQVVSSLTGGDLIFFFCLFLVKPVKNEQGEFLNFFSCFFQVNKKSF